jgi:hypothetical protein
MHAIGEVVKLYEVDVAGLEFPVRGKIIRYTSGEQTTYRWAISHHYKPSAQAAGIYYPSRVTERTLEDAEIDFRAYAEHFVPDYEVRANENF